MKGRRNDTGFNWRKGIFKYNTTKEQLETLYLKMNVTEMGALLSIPWKTIYRHMTRFGIPRKKTRLFITREKLYQLYIVEKKSTAEIGKLYKVASSCIKSHLKKYGIKTRQGLGRFKKGRVPWAKGKFGKTHPGWKHGRANEPYSSEFNSRLKGLIKNRDNHKCQLCGCSEIECLSGLAIHHIDYNKYNSGVKNLISLCFSCHTKTNSNRKYWQEHFNEKINYLYSSL